MQFGHRLVLPLSGAGGRVRPRTPVGLALQAEGIEFLFGLPSPEIDPLFAVLAGHGIRLQGEVRWDVAAQGLGCQGEYVERIEDLDAALRRAQAHAGPSLVCIRSDRDANRAIPADMVTRFFEVYLGPTEQPTPATSA